MQDKLVYVWSSRLTSRNLTIHTVASHATADERSVASPTNHIRIERIHWRRCVIYYISAGLILGFPFGDKLYHLLAPLSSTKSTGYATVHDT